MDKVEVMVEVADVSLLEQYKELEVLKKKLRAAIKTDCLIDTQITLCNPMTLKRFEGKAKRVQDLRKKD